MSVPAEVDRSLPLRRETSCARPPPQPDDALLLHVGAELASNPGAVGSNSPTAPAPRCPWPPRRVLRVPPCGGSSSISPPGSSGAVRAPAGCGVAPLRAAEGRGGGDRRRGPSCCGCACSPASSSPPRKPGAVAPAATEDASPGGTPSGGRRRGGRLGRGALATAAAALPPVPGSERQRQASARPRPAALGGAVPRRGGGGSALPRAPSAGEAGLSARTLLHQPCELWWTYKGGRVAAGSGKLPCCPKLLSLEGSEMQRR